MWHVLQDRSSNQFSRLSDPAYRFVGLLDGRRTVAEAWRAVSEQLGDEAPTQPEAIQLLGQLHVANLLRGDLPPDAATVFGRHRKRTRREIRSTLMSLLFLRIPLLDPDAFLNRWARLFGPVFSWVGMVFWTVLIAAGLAHLAGHWQQLFDRGSEVLNLSNLPYLYLAIVLLKLVHEFSHGFACKRFAAKEGLAGEVHTMGIMLLVFMPVPYVDASSSWALRSKWHRAAVGLAGMWMELAVAAVAAIAWANLAPGDLRAIAYNMIFVAGVSSLLFNGNPLLRYDAYYVLSDLLETPNLAQRSKGYLYYLVKKLAFGVRRPNCPAHSPGEKAWFAVYGLASTAFRVWISVRILLFVADKLFFVGMALAAMALIGWLLVPLGRFFHYLLTSGELHRTRGRAVATTGLFAAGLVTLVGFVRLDDHIRFEGVVEPRDMAVIYSGAQGRLITAGLSPDEPTRRVHPDANPLLQLENPRLLAELERARRDLEILEIRRGLALAEGPLAVEVVDARLRAARAELRLLQRRADALQPAAPLEGVWIAPTLARRDGVWIEQGEQVGLVAETGDLIIRGVVGQNDAAMLIDLFGRGEQRVYRHVQVRLKGRPDVQTAGHIERIAPAGKLELPSRSLGLLAGGSMATASGDRQGRQAAEHFFESVVALPAPAAESLRIGQRVVVRVRLPAKPLAAQWYRTVRQLIQRRFRF
jgi:putative peptide zinc metalloprotease protein